MTGDFIITFTSDEELTGKGFKIMYKIMEGKFHLSMTLNYINEHHKLLNLVVYMFDSCVPGIVPMFLVSIAPIIKSPLISVY